MTRLARVKGRFVRFYSQSKRAMQSVRWNSVWKQYYRNKAEALAAKTRWETTGEII